MKISKVFIVLICSVFWSSIAMSEEECILNEPVEVDLEKAFETTPFSNYYLVGKSIELDKAPTFKDGTVYNPSIDPLVLRLFNIHWDGRPTSYLGVSVAVPDSFRSIGFSNYSGKFNVQHSKYTENTLEVYETLTEETYFGIETKAVTKAMLKFNEGFLISAEITYPIYEFDDSGKINFTGKNETFCIKNIVLQ